MEFIFAGVDGTGTSNDTEYAKVFAMSFVRRLRDAWPTPQLAWYVRGPGNVGVETKNLADAALLHVQRHYKPERGVVLAGYSRGAAAVTHVASELSKRGVPVHCLVLFDSVDRTWTLGGLLSDALITKNVRHCIHAVRDSTSGSRTWFGGSGRQIENSHLTRYVSRHFFCSHGGLGGVPWSDVPYDERVDERTTLERRLGISVTGRVTNLTAAQDQYGSKEVWTWVMVELAMARDRVEREFMLKAH